MNKAFLSIYGVTISVSGCDEVISRLEKDFSYYCIAIQKKPQIIITIENKTFDNLIKRYDYVSDKVSFVDKKINQQKHRLCIYNNRASALWNIEKDQLELVGEDIHLLHEISYLFILSRVGKILDLKGLHRVHAMAVQINDNLIVMSADSGVGKSTICWGLLELPGAKLLSDDSPLIDSQGNVHSFALRFGLSDLSDRPDSWDNFYELNRREFGTKYLFSLDELNYEVGHDYKNIYFLSATRNEGPVEVSSMGMIGALKVLLRNCMIGYGLPMIYEYFWLNGAADFIRKSRIFLKRAYAAFRFSMKARKFRIDLSDDITENIITIESLLKK